MKRISVKTGSKKFITAAAFVALLSVGALRSNAAIVKANESHVEYAGVAQNDNVAFNVQYKNEAGSNFNLTVLNENGDIIFSQQYNDKNFNKKIIIETLPEDAHVTFIIKGADANVRESFNINTNIKQVKNVEVTKA